MKLPAATLCLLTAVGACFQPCKSFAVTGDSLTTSISRRPHTPCAGSCCWMVEEDRHDDNPSPTQRPSADEDTEQLILIAGSFVALTLLGSILNSNPAEFDLDTFFALNRVLDFSSQEIGDNIVELPPLSPAEQIVAAFFGPPSGH
mmetsp:Transcript_23981/g.37047  ORF Transcript_23981/g.37047 Transcript_23981/m.37047 type:complete len:146 (-) Transcript_23981:321-758(-)|eukprot:CAMPEP_0195300686 /NCGR_PEP_ID=MMETSP0707-20130614/27932_1 /TAXON_ID=33640 /ORGANISM="Asterionellopsis glacialis, Strain CCMP134" /LENGTH=145 /DNA_ID=CAMNT_0040363451 /DNA_START=61 /DNA_END=498 /DNA_ORIENTATION=+